MKKNFTYGDELYHYGVKGMKWRHHKKKDPVKGGRTGPRTSDDDDDEDSLLDLIPDSYKQELNNLMRGVSENTPGLYEINELYKIYKNITKEHPEYSVSNMERSFRNQGVGVANLSGPSRRSMPSRTTKRRRKKK